ncbi:hypothetical protein [Leptobacterium sp. I13]|uniref:hypothetical protein n=1 Tax=Leptobacterium meishanense TaxID=3128904 RepID=UPI0030EDE126
MSKYFPSKIYNNDRRRGDEPTFSILSMVKDFNLEDAINKVSEMPPKNIFILINGQQTLELRTNDDVDGWFGRALCGIDRIGEKEEGEGVAGGSGTWKGDYKIYTSSSEHKNVASTLYDEYGANDLIIDVLNAKYDWEKSLRKNTKSFEKFCGRLKEILDTIGDCSSLRFFIAGFSRGGMFSLRLAEWIKMNNYGKETIVVTLDPVIKPGEKDDWVVNWADWKNAILEKNRRWKIGNLHAGSSKYYFPILRAPGDIHYNVFERDYQGIGKLIAGLLVSPEMLASYFLEDLIPYKDYPIGCAVDGAIAPGYEYTGDRADHSDFKLKKLPLESPYDQYDIETREHTPLPTKYQDWVLSIVHKHFSGIELGRSSSIELDKKSTIEWGNTYGNPGSQMHITFQPYPENKPSVSIKINQKKINITWDKDNRSTVNFNIPEDINPGKSKLHVTFDGKNITTNFLVTPFINSCDKKYVPTGAELTIHGKFHKGDKVVIDQHEIIPNYINNSLTVQIPKNITTGKKNLSVLSGTQYYSNNTDLIICETFILPAIEEPIKTAIISESMKINLGEFVSDSNDIFLLNGNEVDAIIYVEDEDTIVELKPFWHTPVGENSFQIVRRKGSIYYLSNSIKVIICNLIGNTNTMELHLDSCIWVTKMLPSNKELISPLIDNLKKSGYDNCHWCLGGSKR